MVCHLERHPGVSVFIEKFNLECRWMCGLESKFRESRNLAIGPKETDSAIDSKSRKFETQTLESKAMQANFEPERTLKNKALCLNLLSGFYWFSSFGQAESCPGVHWSPRPLNIC